MNFSGDHDGKRSIAPTIEDDFPYLQICRISCVEKRTKLAALPPWLHIQKKRFSVPLSWAFLVLLVTPVHRWGEQISIAPVLTRHAWRGYIAAVVGVVLTSFVIVGLNQISHVENISLIYLLMVLWLALTYGRGPSIMAAVLAIVAYDYISVPPVYFFGVFNSSQGIAIIVLFSVALVVG